MRVNSIGNRPDHPCQGAEEQLHSKSSYLLYIIFVKNIHLDVKLTLHAIADLPDENNHLDRPGTIRLSSNKTTRQNAATSL